jgi:branched-chain amino acid transport system substrate-binding protein
MASTRPDFPTDVPRADQAAESIQRRCVRADATDIPTGGTIQGYGVKFHRPGDEMSGQNERSSPVVVQYINGKSEVVWPARLRTAEPVLPWPKSHSYSNQ